MQADEHRRLATILAIDVVGYSAAAERDQSTAARLVSALRERVHALARANGGRVFSTAGDGFMLEFPLVSSAVHAATTLVHEAAPKIALPAVRIGAHVGEVLIAGDDLLGHGVNVAARLQALAEPNSVVISEAVHAQLQGEIKAKFGALGPVRLSKMRETLDAYMYIASADAPGLRRKLTAFSRRHRQAIAAGVAALALAGLVAMAFALRPQGYVLGDLEFVAQSRQSEFQPSLSQDGRFVVYAREMGAEIYTNTDLFMRPVVGGEETPLATEPNFHEYAPAVSPTGAQLAYIKHLVAPLRGPADPCRIMVRVLPNGLDREAGRCVSVIGPPQRLSWTVDERSLVYADALPDDNAPRRIRILDLETGAARDLVPPLESGNGDFNATVSPDGARIAFVRYHADEAGDVYVYHMRNRHLTRVTDGVEWAQVAWADPRNLFVTLRGETGTELWLMPANGRGRRQRLLPALRALSRPVTGTGLLALQAETRVLNLWRAENGAATAITSGNQHDSDAAFSHDGTLAFVSFQPAAWLYLQEPGQQPRRFVELTGEAPRGLRWSPDGRRLVYVARTEDRYRLFTVDAASGLIQQVRTARDANLQSPSWAPDGRSLVCTSRDGRGWRLVRVDAEGDAAPQPISDYGWFEGIETGDGLFATSVTEQGVWRLAPGRAPELFLSVLWPIERAHQTWNWTVVAGRVYAVDRTTGRTRVLSRSVAGGPVTRSLDVEALYGGSLAVDPSTGAIVFGVVVDEQSDIGLIRFQRR